MASKIPTDLQWADLVSKIKAKANSSDIGDATLTIKQNNVAVGTFTANAKTGKDINISVPTKTSDLLNDGEDSTGDPFVSASELSTVATTGSYNDLLNLPTIPTVYNKTITLQKNGTTVDSFTLNQSSNKTINFTISASDVGALPDSTKYGASLSMTIDDQYKAVASPTGNPKSQGWFERSGTSPNYVYTPTNDTSVQSGKTYYTAPTFVITTQLKDQDNVNLGAAQTIDLPIESVVVNGQYDSTNKKIILTLQDGSTIDIPVGDLVAGLQTELTASNKLNADYIDYSQSNTKPTLVGSSAPTTSTVGAKGQMYVNNSTGDFYICTNVSGSTYTWTKQDGTTYSDFTGADGTHAGTHGLVIAPAATDNTKFLKGDGSWATPTDTNTHRPIKMNGSQILGDNTTALDLTAGTNITLTNSSGKVTIKASDTTYSDFVGTDGTTAGTAGLVPAPATTDAGKYLKADGSWGDPTFTLAPATTSTLGGVIVGDGLTVTNQGVLAVNTFTTTEWNNLWA